MRGQRRRIGVQRDQYAPARPRRRGIHSAPPGPCHRRRRHTAAPGLAPVRPPIPHPHAPPHLHALSLPSTVSIQATGASDLPPPRRSPAVAPPPGYSTAAAEKADLLWLAHAGKITFELPGKDGLPTTMTMHGVAPL